MVLCVNIALCFLASFAGIAFGLAGRDACGGGYDALYIGCISVGFGRFGQFCLPNVNRKLTKPAKASRVMTSQ
jgi:hypothetical protein